MSSNLLKGSYVYYQDQDRRVIDSNELVATKMEEIYASLEEAEDGVPVEEGFKEGLDALDLLLQDQDETPAQEGGESAEGTSNVIKARPETGKLLEEARAQAGRILEDAREQAQELEETARKQGRAAGYEEGYREGQENAARENRRREEELSRMERDLEADYEKQLSEMEPKLVDVIGDVYAHVFSVDFSERKDIICNLLRNALQNMEITKDFIIHVSKEDFGYVTMQKKALLAGMPGADTIEIVEDITLSPNECLIETGSGIYDCSLGVQLEALTKELKLLSFTHGEGK